MKGEAVRLESLRSATPLRTRPSLATTKWRLKQLGYSWHRSLMRRYEDFSVVTRDSLVCTLRTLGLKYDTKVFERKMNKTMFKALRMQRDELGLTPDYRVRGFSALVEKRSSVPG